MTLVSLTEPGADLGLSRGADFQKNFDNFVDLFLGQTETELLGCYKIFKVSWIIRHLLNIVVLFFVSILEEVSFGVSLNKKQKLNFRFPLDNSLNY